MISGIIKHNLACQEALMDRLPAIPLHEHVYKVALSQLENGARFVSICVTWFVFMFLQFDYYSRDERTNDQ